MQLTQLINTRGVLRKQHVFRVWFHSTSSACTLTSTSVLIVTTLFLPSIAKLLHTILSFTFLEYLDGSRVALWTNDGNIQYFSPEHAPLFLVAMAVLLLLWLPYTALLLFVQCLQKHTNHKVLRWVTNLKPFVDVYFGPFKDRHCYWFGAMLLV